MPDKEANAPESMTDGQNIQTTSKLIGMFYDENTGRCGSGSELCGVSGKAMLAASNQHVLAKASLNIPALFALAVYYSIALPIAVIASIVRFRIMMPRFVISETPGGVGVRYGSPPTGGPGNP